MRGSLEQVLRNPERRDEILNAVIKSYRPEARAQHWSVDGAFPRFIASDGGTAIDVMEGLLLEKGKALLPLSNNLRRHEHLVALFGPDEQIQAAQVDWGVYEFRDKRGDLFRLIQQEGKSDVLQRQLNGRWLQAESGGSFAAQLPFIGLFKNSLVWVAGDPHPEAFVGDRESDQFKYRIELEREGEEAPCKIVAVHRLDEEEQDSGLILSNIYSGSTPYSFLERFEDGGQILVWEEKTTQKPALIELPRFGLSFEVKEKEGRSLAFCQQQPGYFLAQHQLVAQLGDMTNYLVLEKEQKGEKKQLVLMPRQPMAPLADFTLITETHPQRELDKPEKPQTYFAYDLNFKIQIQERLDGSARTGAPMPLQPRGEGARFHLAMMHLWERDYRSAMRLLRGYGTELGGYSSEELEGLKWIQELAARNRDQTPQAKAVRLYAEFLMMRNAVDFGNVPLDENYLKTVAERYLDYLQIRSELKDLAQKGTGVDLCLQPEEELLIQKQLNNPAISLFLSGEAEPTVPATDLDFARPVTSSQETQEAFEAFIREAKSFKGGQAAKETTSTLLRSQLLPSFFALYSSFQKREYATALPQLIEQFLGEAPPKETPVEKLREQALQLLWVARNSQTKGRERVAAALLGAALSQPDASPPLTEIEKWLENAAYWGNRKETIEKLKAEWLAPAMQNTFYSATGFERLQPENVSVAPVFALKTGQLVRPEPAAEILAAAPRMEALIPILKGLL